MERDIRTHTGNLHLVSHTQLFRGRIHPCRPLHSFPCTCIQKQSKENSIINIKWYNNMYTLIIFPQVCKIFIRKLRNYINIFIIVVNLRKCKSESCELSFIWGKMRAAAWETAPQIALRRRSKEAGVEVGVVKDQYMSDFGEGGIHTVKHIFFPRSFLLVL